MRLHFLLLIFVCSFASCTAYEELRIRQLLNEKGFGTRAEGNATVENYLAGGDGVVFVLSGGTLTIPGAQRLALLTRVQLVGLDGTILLPYVGPIPVLGLTEQQLERLVESSLAGLFAEEIQLQARIVDRQKAFYAFGEVGRKGRLPYRKADFTLFEAIASLAPTRLANLGRVRLIKPDAEDPLVIDVNVREMIITGNTRYNAPVEVNDIIYVPATWIGGFARFIEKLLQPLNVAVRSMLGLARIKASYDVLTGESSFYFRY